MHYCVAVLFDSVHVEQGLGIADGIRGARCSTIVTGSVQPAGYRQPLLAYRPEGWSLNMSTCMFVRVVTGVVT